MSQQPAYELKAHPRARGEINEVPEPQQTRLRDRIQQAARTRKPTDAKHIEHLQGLPFLKAHVDGYRAILEFSKPELRVLLVDKRRVVYDRLETAMERSDQ